MHPEPPTKTISAVMGLTAFALAVIAGWAAHNPLSTILTRAIIAMAVCYAVGQILGWAATKLAREYMADFRARNPVPQATPVEVDPETDAQDPRNPDDQTLEASEIEAPRAAA